MKSVDWSHDQRDELPPPTRLRQSEAPQVCVDDGERELAALAYLPPSDQVLAGAMCAAPEGSGFQVAFDDLKVVQPA